MTEPTRASGPDGPTDRTHPTTRREPTDPRGRRDPRVRRARRDRGARESLLSVVLVLEAVMFFFPMLAVFGKHELPAGIAFGGGFAFMIVLAIASALTGRPAGVWFGWLLQAAIIATGFVEPFMFVVGLVFLAMWVYCFVKGGQLDRTNAARRAEWEAENPGA